MTSQEGGRVNQKQRTRAALLTAAADLMQNGQTPTVAEVAETAAISRATAYRYFPSQDLMLAEAALDAAVPDIEAMLARVERQDDPFARLDRLVHDVQSWVADNEVMFRTLLRLSMDPALDGDTSRGGTQPRRRGGRRLAWLADTLEPVRGRLQPDRFRMLVAAMALFTGFETQVVLRDVCGLDRDEADTVARWGASMMLAGALRTEALEERAE